MPNTRTIIQQFGLTLFSLFSVARGYNIVVLAIAQYLAAIFIFSPEKSLSYVLLDINLLFIVVASAFVIAGGYIINNFYDKETDKINRPIKSKIDAYSNQNMKLSIYFLLNFTGVLLGYLVSWKAAGFFAIYIFLIWFYSHKLRKYPIIGLISITVLTIMPFFAVFVYYKNFSKIIFVHAIFLFLLLMIRELVKNLENMDGNIITGLQTVPIKYGERFTKQLCTFLVIILLAPIYVLWHYPEIGWMKFYFYFAMIMLLIFIISLWKSNSNRSYTLLHNILKILIIVGVFSLMLIDTSVIIGRLI